MWQARTIIKSEVTGKYGRATETRNLPTNLKSGKREKDADRHPNCQGDSSPANVQCHQCGKVRVSRQTKDHDPPPRFMSLTKNQKSSRPESVLNVSASVRSVVLEASRARLRQIWRRRSGSMNEAVSSGSPMSTS